MGEDVENIWRVCMPAADMTWLPAKGIVFVDGVDKIARKSDNPSIAGMWAARGATGHVPGGARGACAATGRTQTPTLKWYR